MLYEQIKSKLHSQHKHYLSKELGYNNQKNFEKTLQKFLSHTSLHEWFQSGNYDFVNQPYDFFKKLSYALELDKELIKETLEKEEAYLKELERFRGTYIFINTDFKRNNEPIFVLALLEHERTLSLCLHEELYFKSTQEVLEIVSKMIKEHYEKNQGKLVVWGEIASYQVHVDKKTYIFDTSGVLLKQAEPAFESYASLHLK
jgi:hypothetical protein